MEPSQSIFIKPIYSISLQANQSCGQIRVEGTTLATVVDNLKYPSLQSRTVTLEEFPQGRKNSASFTAMPGNFPVQLSEDRCFFGLQLLAEKSNEVGKSLLEVLTFDTCTTHEISYHPNDLSVVQGTGMTVGYTLASARVNFWDLAVMKPVYQTDCPAERTSLQSRCFFLPDDQVMALTFQPRNQISFWDSRLPNRPVTTRILNYLSNEITSIAMLETWFGPRLVMTTKGSSTINFLDLFSTLGRISHQFDATKIGSTLIEGDVSIVSAQDGILTTRIETHLYPKARRSTLCSYNFLRDIPKTPVPFNIHKLDSNTREFAPGKQVVCNNETFAYAYNGAIEIYRRS